LLANMWSLYFLGDTVLTYYGGRKLLIAYVLTGLGGSLLSLVLLPPLTPTIGASGAVFGLAGLLVGGMLRRQRYGMEFPFGLQDVFPLIMMSLVYGFTAGSNINNAAHFGGLIAGILLGLGWNHYAAVKIGALEKFVTNALFILCGLVTIVALGAATVALWGLVGVG
jgi:membrane associated rhomboid family serine protease